MFWSIGRGQLYPHSNQASSPACWYIEHEPKNKKKRQGLQNKAEETSLCIYDTVNAIILLSKTWITCLNNLRKCCWNTPIPFSTPSLSLPHAGQMTKKSRSVSRNWCWVGLSHACSKVVGGAHEPADNFSSCLCFFFFCRSDSSILQSSQESLTFPPCWLQTPTKLLPTLLNRCLVFTDMTYACKLKLSGGIQIMRKYTNNDVYWQYAEN